MTLRGLLICPFTETVTTVHRDFNDIKEIYRAIGSYDMGHISLTPTVMAYLDDNGVFRKGQAWFTLGQFPMACAGRWLLLGYNQEGDNTDCPILQPSTVLAGVNWLSAAEGQALVRPTVITSMSTNGNLHREEIPITGFETLPMPYIDNLATG